MSARSLAEVVLARPYGRPLTSTEWLGRSSNVATPKIPRFSVAPTDPAPVKPMPSRAALCVGSFAVFVAALATPAASWSLATRPEVLHRSRRVPVLFRARRRWDDEDDCECVLGNLPFSVPLPLRMPTKAQLLSNPARSTLPPSQWLMRWTLSTRKTSWMVSDPRGA